MPQDTPNKGQSKVHTITNPATGETREVTQEQWRQDGQALRQQGFTRPDDDLEAEEGTETEDTAS